MNEKTIVKQITDVLDDAKIRYVTVPGHPAVQYVMPLRDSKLTSCMMTHGAEKNGILTVALLPLKADPPRRAAVSEFLQRLNGKLVNGVFLLNMDTGALSVRVFFRFPEDADGIIVPKKLIAAHMLLPMMLLQRYGDALLSVLFDTKLPKEAAEGI